MESTRPKSREDIFNESLEQLIERWLKVPSEQYEKPTDQTARAIAERVIKRASSVITFSKVQEPHSLKMREWKYLWSPKLPFEKLKRRIEELGWRVIVTDDTKALKSMSVLGQSSARDTLFLQMSGADDTARAVAEAGFPHSFGPEDALPILLARELYEIAADQMGHRPQQPWLDDLAAELAVQRLTGIPFNPILLSII